MAAIAIVAALTVPIAWRRRAPLAVACVVMTAAVALAALLPEFNSLASPMFVLVIPPYSVAANEGRQRALAGLAVCLAGALCVNAVRPDGRDVGGVQHGDGGCVVGDRPCASLAAAAGR